ncbi:hypothetical protein IM40_09790 (plasmid) [Candidatus Paracaedimonas acanthamoebae]|nr:hypothetical protein IM40_09790 [Candidatus Paracaedimonas acanthamoebae]
MKKSLYSILKRPFFRKLSFTNFPSLEHIFERHNKALGTRTYKRPVIHVPLYFFLTFFLLWCSIGQASYFGEAENSSASYVKSYRHGDGDNSKEYHHQIYRSPFNNFKRAPLSQLEPLARSSNTNYSSDRSKRALKTSIHEKDSSLHKKQKVETSLVTVSGKGNDPQAGSLESYKSYKRDHKDQHIKLTCASRYVVGEICAQMRWVHDLGCYYGKQNLPVPARHTNLALIGNHIKAWCTTLDPKSSKRNVLVPFVSFIEKDAQGQHHVSKGDYLSSSEAQVLAFISGPSSYDEAEELYENYAECTREDLPTIKIMGGDRVSSWVGRNFGQLNKDADYQGRARPYNFHTEEWFHEVINTYPQLITNPIINSVSSGSKVCAIILDMYSWQDVCEECQVKFKRELFQRTTITRFQDDLRCAGLRLPKNGIKVVFRVLSERSYYSGITTQELPLAEGGCDREKGFDIKAVGPAQVTLCSRKTPTYPNILANVKDFYNESD